MNIIGISAFYHDSAACLLKDGDLLAAAQEERFTRKRHDASFPKHAIQYCLRSNNLNISDIDAVVFYEKPFIKFNRILETILEFVPRGFSSYIHSIPLWLGDRIWMAEEIRKQLNYKEHILFAEHHESHAASAYFPSPFERAAFLTVDGVGEWATATYGTGSNNRIEILAEQHFPHSLGLLYSAFTYQAGFKVNSGEYKVMGLAPYGEPRFVQQIYDHLIDLKEDGSFSLNLKYFDYTTGLRMTNGNFDALFGGRPRVPESLLTQREMDLARSIQDVTDEIMLRKSRHVKKETGEKYLCLAGGVALNCVANGKILREGLFEEIWIQPGAGDAGGAIGAAYLAYHHHFRKDRSPSAGSDRQHGSSLGPEYSQAEIKDYLSSHNIPFRELAESLMLNETIELLLKGKVVGWFQGRMEFGPRALGNRSILGDPRNPEMQKNMNLKIKFREGFRPFAPSVLEEDVREWFDFKGSSPYMLLVTDVLEKHRTDTAQEQAQLWGIDKLNVQRSRIPAVTHIDFSARLQTVNRQSNPLYYRLIDMFKQRTGCPMLVNTSFNVRGEPIVATPADAYQCFMRTALDALIIGNCILIKEDQPPMGGDQSWKKHYELD